MTRSRRPAAVRWQTWVLSGLLVALCAAPAPAQTPAPPTGAPGGDLFAPLTNLFNEAALSLSGPFGLVNGAQYNVTKGERS